MTHVLAAARAASVLIPAAAATTARTANIDTVNANFALVSVQLGAELNTNSTNVSVTLGEADSTSDTFETWTSTLSNIVVDNTAAVVATFPVPLVGRKRYLRLTVTPDTTTNGPVLTGASVLFDDSTRTK